MKILWITNIVFPEATQILLGNKSSKGMSGGWLLGAADMLVQQSGVDLIVASISKDVSTLTRLEGEMITYYLLPYGKGNLTTNHEYEPLWQQVWNETKPDIVHIHGTEYSHGLAYIEACGTKNVCVSIQGLVSSIANYYTQGLCFGEIIKSSTIGSLIRGGILSLKRVYKQRGICEKEILKKVQHVIGRTSWDKAHLWAINPQASYHYGGETLRSVFYEEPLWDYWNCIPHTIFLSQVGYPVKGLHMLLKALPLVLSHFPDTKVRVAGRDITKLSGIRGRLMMDDWGNYVRKMIKSYNLLDVVSFTGPLDAIGMRDEYLKCNVFVCPSSVENSPNSLGEAQLLGVPAIASYVGGIPDMMKGDEEHLYRFEEVEMLAFKICELFDLGDGVDTSFMRNIALHRHDPQNNIQRMMEIYHSIIEK